MTIEIITFILICALALILSLYHHRQAASLRAIECVVQDYYAMQFRSIRREYAGSLDTLNSFEWISNHVSAGMDKPVTITDVIRTVPEIQTVDLRTSDNRRVVVSPHSYGELYAFDRRARHTRRSDRLASFAARPLLNNSRFGWGVKTIEGMTSNTDEFFDLEADVIGRKLGVAWNQPTRLFFYILGQQT
jgi:hypothetical protein